MTEATQAPHKPAGRAPEDAVAPLNTIHQQDVGAGAAGFDKWLRKISHDYVTLERLSRTIGKDWPDLMAKSGAAKFRLGSAEWESRALNANADWIVERNHEGYSFIDIGEDGSPNKSPFYVIEKQTLHQIGGKVYKGAPTAINEARKKSKPSARPKSKVLCSL